MFMTIRMWTVKAEGGLLVWWHQWKAHKIISGPISFCDFAKSLLKLLKLCCSTKMLLSEFITEKVRNSFECSPPLPSSINNNLLLQFAASKCEELALFYNNKTSAIIAADVLSKPWNVTLGKFTWITFTELCKMNHWVHLLHLMYPVYFAAFGHLQAKMEYNINKHCSVDASWA